MPNVEIFNKGVGYILSRPAQKRISKLFYIEETEEFSLTVQNGICVRYYSKLFPDLIEAQWNEEIYIEPIIETKHSFQDISYIKKSIELDDYVVDRYVIIFNRDFFANINLNKQRDTVEKIIRTITGLWLIE